MKKTSECVGFGHPDKICDRIADKLVNEFLRKDKASKCGIEVLAKGFFVGDERKNTIIVAGEVNSNATVDIESIVKKIVSPMEVNVLNLLTKQSIEINKSVEKNDGEVGAGDQGIVFGYANNETSDYMPLTIWLARKLIDFYYEVKTDSFENDCKSQVTVDYSNNKLTDIVFSCQHKENISLDEVRFFIENKVIKACLNKYKNNINIDLDLSSINFRINTAGSWNIGGIVADCGVTGRKLVVDHYGCDSQIGGGNLSGKDPSKVDRTGSYFARYLAKNIVANGYANEAKIYLSYAIGEINPLSFSIVLDKEHDYNTEIVKKIITEKISLTVKGMIDHLQLTNMDKQDFYLNSTNGHFGNSQNTWEKIVKF